MSSPPVDERPGAATQPALGNELDDGRHAVAQFRLRTIAGPDAGASFHSSGERTVIGTHPSTDFALSDPTMSRFHCEIDLTEEGPVVRDLGSRNGTLVNGVAVLAARLRPAAILTLGNTQIEFDIGSERVTVPLSDRERFGSLVGRSRSMRSLFALLERAARSTSTVLLQGETGTGKDAAAEAIHSESDRRDGPFVVVECGALPTGLLESELFGHEQGAFTGAASARQGAFEAAAGGTLVLDEVGELELELQPKLLRALERRESKRVGGNRRTPLDVRVIAATNRNLRVEVNAGRFRSDLFFRLAVLEITVPPLREHVDDIPLLVASMLDQLGAGDHPAAAALRSPAAERSLMSAPWPGNVRELRNYVERCLAFEAQLPLSDEVPESMSSLIDARQPLRAARARWLRTFERRYLEELLRLHDDNVAAAARSAGVDRAHLHRLLSRCGLR